jgi:hypothetical protein
MKPLVLILLLLPLSAAADEFGNPDNRASLTVVYAESFGAENYASVWNAAGEMRSNEGTQKSGRVYWSFTQPLTKNWTFIQDGWWTKSVSNWPATNEGWERSRGVGYSWMLGAGVRVYLW